MESQRKTQISASLGGLGVTSGPVCPGRAVVTSWEQGHCPHVSPAQPWSMGETGNGAGRKNPQLLPAGERWDTVTLVLLGR